MENSQKNYQKVRGTNKIKASPSRREKHTLITQEVLSSCFPTTIKKQILKSQKNLINLVVLY
jgi:hypothetical protein